MARDEGGAPRRPQQALQQHKKKSPPSLKNQLRSIDRLLQKVTEKQQRASLELRKAELEKAQVDSRRAERERKLAVRYHKVKFFGAFSAPHARVPSSPEQSARRSRESRRSCARPSRRKAGCASSSAELRSRLTPAPGERGAAREAAAAGRGRRVHAGAILSFLSTRRSSRAAQHFPRGEKYVSLFTEGGDVAHAERERARLRALVKARAASASRLSPHPPAQANLRAAAALAEQDEGASAERSCFLHSRPSRRPACGRGCRAARGTGAGRLFRGRSSALACRRRRAARPAPQAAVAEAALCAGCAAHGKA